MPSRQRHFQFWLGIFISAVFLTLALKNVDGQQVWNSWKNARPLGLVVGFVLLVFCWIISALRWRLLLSPAPGLRVRDTFAYITIGYLANTVLPLRLGDLARATLIGRNKGLGISRSLGSMALERILDLLSLLGIALMLTWLMEIPSSIKAGVVSMTGLAFGGLAFLVIVSMNRRRLDVIASFLSKFIPDQWAERGTTLLANFTSGVDVLYRPGKMLLVILLSMMVWICAGLSAWFWVKAFNIEAPWYAAYFVLVVINLGSAIPSSPGYIGVYHYLAVLALSVWVPDRDLSLAFAIGTHALNMLANIALGAFFLAREGVSLHDLRAAEG